jgi:2-oxoglutarate ferredoxin oxidoreductase subunit delta
LAKKPKNVVEVYESGCKRCGICVAFCPVGALALDETGKVRFQDPDRCTGCQLCELRCPDFAIHVRTAGKKQERGKAEKPPEKTKEESGEKLEKT